jgi:hypothetical protein
MWPRAAWHNTAGCGLVTQALDCPSNYTSARTHAHTHSYIPGTKRQLRIRDESGLRRKTRRLWNGPAFARTTRTILSVEGESDCSQSPTPRRNTQRRTLQQESPATQSPNGATKLRPLPQPCHRQPWQLTPSTTLDTLLTAVGCQTWLPISVSSSNHLGHAPPNYAAPTSQHCSDSLRWIRTSWLLQQFLISSATDILQSVV